MKALLGSIAISSLLAVPALAADLPARVPVKAPAPIIVAAYNWTGCYIGVNAGGHFGRDKITSTTTPANFVAGGAAAIDAQSPVTLSPSGFIGGGQIGCNWQSSSFVLGIEGDGEWLSGSDSRRITFTGPPAGAQMGNQVKDSWLSTVRGRAGFAVDRTLFYGTGGVAFGGLKTTDSLFAGGVTTTVSTTKSRVGWTAGGGIEHAFGANWTAKIEYLYVDLRHFDVSIPCQVACVSTVDTVIHHRYTDHIIRAGLNYRFGGPVVARY